MKSFRIALLAPLALSFVAGFQMQDAPSPSAASMPGADACSAEQYQGLVTQNEVALSTMAFPHTVRVFHPGDAVTKDLRLDRMNIHVDANGRITAVDCG